MEFETHTDLQAALDAGTFLFKPEFFPASFRCSQCRQLKPLKHNCGTGYARNDANEFLCYQCCGENDAKELREKGKAVLYWTGAKPGDAGEVTNWPGTFRIPVRHVRTGAHNIARRRYDVWFMWEGRDYHGVQYGDNTQICRVKQVRA